MPNVREEGTRREKGSLLVVAIFGVMALILALAVAVDVARFLRLEHQAQVVADEAALGAAHYLPDTIAARRAAASFIKQRWPHYNIDDSGYAHLQDSAGNAVYAEIVNVATRTQASDSWASCTIAVSVQALFDPIFTPRWLYGNYATSGILKKTTVLAEWDDVPYPLAGPPPGSTSGDASTWAGDKAVLVGDSGACADTADVGGRGGSTANNINVCGNAAFNGGLSIDANNVDVECGGTLSAGGLNENGNGNLGEQGGDNNYTQSIDTSGPQVAFPTMPDASLNMDVVVDTDDAASPYFGWNGAETYLVATDGTRIKGGTKDVKIKLNAVTGSFELVFQNPKGDIDAASNPTMGNGVDMKFDGSVDLGAPNVDFEGTIWATQRIEIGSNNGEFRAGRAGTNGDNGGLVLYVGAAGDADGNDGTLDIQANMSQLSLTGLIVVDGNTLIDGNASNNTYAINGALWTRRADSNCGADGGFHGNNWGINYNAANFDEEFFAGPRPSEDEIRYRSNTPRARIIR